MNISVRNIRTIDYVKNNKVLRFFHEIFIINVKLYFNLKFWGGILS